MWSEEKEVKTPQEALAGAMDIVAESISDEADYRIRIRKMTMKSGLLVSSAKKPEESTVYDMYYEYEEPVSKVARPQDSGDQPEERRKRSLP